MSKEVIVFTIDSDKLLRPESKISIYPNPSQGLFRISFSDDVQYEAINLYDAIGRETKFAYEQITQSEIDVTVNRPVAGGYLLLIKTKSGNIIKERLVLE